MLRNLSSVLPDMSVKTLPDVTHFLLQSHFIMVRVVLEYWAQSGKTSWMGHQSIASLYCGQSPNIIH